MTTEHDRLVGTLARVDRAAERLAEARASLAAAVEDCAPTRLSIPGRIVAVVDDGKITEWRFLPWASDAGYCGDPYEPEPDDEPTAADLEADRRTEELERRRAGEL